MVLYGYFVTGLVGSQLLDRFYGKEITVEADGGRSSNDGFFSKGNRQPDPQDIRKAALSNFEARAISSFLGLKNFTAQDLKENGISPDAVTKVEYAKGAEGGGNTALISEPQAKRLWAICKENQVSEDRIREYIKTQFSYDSSAKIERKNYEAICSWAQTGGKL